MNVKTAGRIIGPVLFLVVLFGFHPEGLSDPGRAVLAVTLWVAAWWVTEAAPLAVTALLPIILLPLSGGQDISTTTAAYGDKMLFLFIGGFILAIAIEKWGLHKRIALTVILRVGTNARMLILGFMVATGFLSMWISNTATTLMMVTIGTALVSQLKELFKTLEGKERQQLEQNFGKALMLGISYSASIAGMATIIGTPTNPIFLAMAKRLFDVEISFAQWFLFGFPLSWTILLLTWYYLVNKGFKIGKVEIPGGRAEISSQLKQLGSITYEERVILIVFIVTAISWMTRSFILNKIIPGIDDTIIALMAAVVLFLIPSKTRGQPMLLDWESAVRLPWGIILLFGGGLSLATGFKNSGLADWIGTQLTLLQGVELLLIILLVTMFVNFMTEVTTNVATASIILPVLASLAQGIGVHPYGLMIAATLAASCAFMLPTATAPNAIVFSTGQLRIQDMVRAGFMVNLTSVLVITLVIYYIMPMVFKINLAQWPF